MDFSIATQNAIPWKGRRSVLTIGSHGFKVSSTYLTTCGIKCEVIKTLINWQNQTLPIETSNQNNFNIKKVGLYKIIKKLNIFKN